MKGDGFFVYQGEEGKLYSRSGVLFRNSETNELVNGDGLPILGEDGPITVDWGDLRNCRWLRRYDFSRASSRSESSRSCNSTTIGCWNPMDRPTFEPAPRKQLPADGIQVQQGVRELSNAMPLQK